MPLPVFVRFSQLLFLRGGGAGREEGKTVNGSPTNHLSLSPFKILLLLENLTGTTTYSLEEMHIK